MKQLIGVLFLDVSKLIGSGGSYQGSATCLEKPGEKGVSASDRNEWLEGSAASLD